jgi:uncharacterized protein YceK
LAKLLLASLILSVTNGCATVSTEAVPLNSYCAIAKPITYDATKDTPETVAEVELHNGVFVCLCEQDCPKGS